MQKQKQKHLQLYAIIHNQILCVCPSVHVNVCVCVGVHKSCTVERATEQTGQIAESLAGWLTVCLSLQLSICPSVALCALICGHKA